MKKILLTLDYELFGNGSGDVFKHIIEPAEKILSIAENNNAQITIFFEVIEYWRLKEEWDNGNAMGYSKNPIEAIENQIRQAVNIGHNVQLHLHPQWVDAVWKDGKWHVNESDWRLGDYNGDGKSKYSLLDLFVKGKETLENLIKPIRPDYECNIARAGWYCIQPSERVVEAMRESGFRYDSSVYPGGIETTKRQLFDFTQLPDGVGFWYCGRSVEEVVSESDIIELPIVGLNILRIRKFLSFGRLAALMKNKTNSKETLEAKTSDRSWGGKLFYFFSRECQTWDYCLLSKSLHREFMRKIERQKDRNVFVLVGHPKSLFDDGKNFDWLLKKLARRNFIFPTITSIGEDANNWSLLRCDEGHSSV